MYIKLSSCRFVLESHPVFLLCEKTFKTEKKKISYTHELILFPESHNRYMEWSMHNTSSDGTNISALEEGEGEDNIFQGREI